MWRSTRLALGSIRGDHTTVKSNHHQGVETLGRPGSRDGVGGRRHVEAVEEPERRFAVGVLWHPEAGEDLKLFEALVAEARAYREEHRS